MIFSSIHDFNKYYLRRLSCEIRPVNGVRIFPCLSATFQDIDCTNVESIDKFTTVDLQPYGMQFYSDRCDGTIYASMFNDYTIVSCQFGDMKWDEVEDEVDKALKEIGKVLKRFGINKYSISFEWPVVYANEEDISKLEELRLIKEKMNV